jgi:succinate-semialdehyde dehydrogenase
MSTTEFFITSGSAQFGFNHRCMACSEGKANYNIDKLSDNNRFAHLSYCIGRNMNPPSFAATSVNPATGGLIEAFRDHTAFEVEQILEGAQTGFATWRKESVEGRAIVLARMAAALRQNAHRYATSITNEMGKPIGEALAEIEKCAAHCDWYAQNGSQLLADKPLPVPAGLAYASYLPLGVVLGVMPWNFPFWQVLRAAVPIILSGNCFVLKHARNVMRSAFNILEAWRDSDLPDGVFSVINVPDPQVAGIIADPRIVAVSVTAGARTGAIVGGQASSCLKKSVLELGGADAFIVLQSADLDRAAAAGVKARFQNNGQVCIAAKRFLLEESIAEEFTERFLEKLSALKLGDPTDPATQLGPMARADLRTELDRQIAASRHLGAELLTGGEAVRGRGFYYQPTVLHGVEPGMPVFEEETFGPCAAMITIKDADEAVLFANQSQYGLSSSLWTEDVSLAQKIARRIEAGGVFINSFSASDPRVPIGGVKRSGYGRELAEFGIAEFVNVQTVWLNRPC